MKRWNLRQTVNNTACDSLASHIIAARGVNIETQGISDPLLISGMEKGAEVIKAALYSGGKIAVFGDYDCDGVTSTVMLYQYLTAQGGEVEWYIPSRDEGYGLNTNAIDELAEKGVELIITVDNGISAAREAAYIKSLGIKLVITDHHAVPDVMPEADAVINPKRPDDESPFKELAGCGVVLKLIMAMEGDIEGVLEQFADLAAIGTIGDVVPLLGENREIVKRGLEIMPYTENIGLYKLLRQSGFSLDEDDNGRLTAGALSFTVCPRINAAGRFTHAKKAAELLLSESEEAAELRSAELTELNNMRREVEADILSQIDAVISENPGMLSERVLVLRGENWHSGVIGIVSSRLLTKWGKPNIIIADDGENLRGSARSVEGFPLVPLMEHCRNFLEKFGGHVKAAGFTAKSENYNALTESIKSYSEQNYLQMPVDVFNIDKIIEPEDLSLLQVEGLKKLAPFGEGNPVALFLMQNCVILSKKPLKDGKYLSFNVKIGSAVQKILDFGCTYDDFTYENGQTVDILVTLDINEYNNVKSVSAQLKDIRPAGFNQEKHFAAHSTYESLVRGEKIASALAARAIPEKDDIKIIYDILRLFTNSTDAHTGRVYAEASARGLNYCKFRIILDVLKEFGLIEHDIINNKVKLKPVTEKANLESSRILKEMRALVGVEKL
ncbi:MAG: single-stranded-DNA-specific exonuclease RecJ [Oscillospiraceae bacterium]|nr:single-stranded-DNA-specific exonuclease RecJ [Oscillospiraceae bacterium]